MDRCRIFRYAGPNSQLVTYRFQAGLSAYLTSGQSMIFASLDGRGTQGRGGRFKYEMYKSFGTVEVDDQLDAIRFVRSSCRSHYSRPLAFIRISSRSFHSSDSPFLDIINPLIPTSPLSVNARDFILYRP